MKPAILGLAALGILGSGNSASAQEAHVPPVIPIEQFSLDGTSLGTGELVAGRAILSEYDQASFSGQPVSSDSFVAETRIGYSELEDGDVAGLALVDGSGQWVSIQLERITPALLVAVRSHLDGEIQPAGRLLATTSVPGSEAKEVKLRIAAQGGMLELSWAVGEGGEWQVLEDGVMAPGDASHVGVFAFDGAER